MSPSKSGAKRIPWIIAKISLVLIVNEILIMKSIGGLEIRGLNPWLEGLLDATVLTLVSAPIVYYWVLKELEDDLEAEMPLEIMIAKFGVVIFSVECGIMLAFSTLLPSLSGWTAILLDSFILILASVPILYFWVVRPSIRGRKKEPPDSPFHDRLPSALRTFLAAYIPSLTVLSGFIFSVYLYEERNQWEVLQSAERNQLNIARTAVVEKLRSAIGDLIILSRQSELMELLEGEEHAKELLGRDYVTLAEIKEDYDQIQLLDENGGEIIRINNNIGDPIVVAEEKLQQKTGRYYFQETMRLGPNDIYISPMDLNIENGNVEVPFRPVIRFGAPVYDGEERFRGALVINLLGEGLFRNLKESSAALEGNLMLLNEGGHWLYGAGPENMWGFMIPERSGRTFQGAFSSEWPVMAKTDHGQFRSDNGLFTFTTLRYSTRVMDDAAGEVPLHRTRWPVWKFVSHLPPSVEPAGLPVFRDNLILLYCVLVPLLTLGSWTTARAIARRKSAELEVRINEKRYRALFENMTSGVAVCEAVGGGEDFIFKDFNNAAERINRIKREELLGKRVTEAFPTIRDSGLLDVFKQVHRTETPQQHPVASYGDEGIRQWLENRVYKLSSHEIVSVHDDVTEQKRAEERLMHMAQNDALTGLPNRRMFMELLNQDLAHARRDRDMLAVMFLDLDYFKFVNDRLGHDVGDMLLVEVAERLQSCLRESDTVARLGGDEFTVILPVISHQKDASIVARKIIKRLGEPFYLKEHECKVGVSIGISLHPKHGDDPETLLQKADLALYGVKNSGRNDVRLYSQDTERETRAPSRQV